MSDERTLVQWRNAIRWAVQDAEVEHLCQMIKHKPIPDEIRKDIAYLVELGAVHGIPGNKSKRKKVVARLSDAYIDFAYTVEHKLNDLRREPALAKVARQTGITPGTAEEKLKRARKGKRTR